MVEILYIYYTITVTNLGIWWNVQNYFWMPELIRTTVMTKEILHYICS